MAQPFNLGNSFLGKSTIELVNPANTAVSTTISVDSDGDLFFQRYVDDLPKGNLKFPVHSYGQSEKKNMHTDANGDVRFANTWTEAITVTTTGGDANAGAGGETITGVEYLVIAGGGGGTDSPGSTAGGRGAGGAGGYRTNVSGALTGGGGSAETLYNDLAITTTFVSVGAGGLRNNHVQATSVNDGEKSIFGPVISDGGGGGSHYIGGDDPAVYNNTGNPGGSGGGSCYSNNFAPAIPTYDGLPQGCDGGNDTSSGGAGGGAGAAGFQGETDNKGNPGGAGLPSSITGTEIWRGGGGGAAVYSGGSGIGGQGGGGDGSEGGVSSPGEPNTGGGGGSSSKNGQGADGGSGVVILASPQEIPYIDGNLAYNYSVRPSDQAHVYEFVGGAGQISAEANPAFYSKELENACLFDGGSCLSRTVNTASNTKTYTFSCWFKKTVAKISSDMAIFGQGNGNKDSLVVLQSGENNLWFLDRNGANAYHEAEPMNDPSTWYHVVYKIDTTESVQMNRAKIYVNGSLRSRDDNQQPHTQNHSTAINDNVDGRKTAYIGRNPWGASGYFSGYMANIQFIDGAALDANAFGTYREGVWIPKQYGSGDTANAQAEYGTNGFHLDFSDADDLGKDVSGKNNHWT